MPPAPRSDTCSWCGRIIPLMPEEKGGRWTFGHHYMRAGKGKRRGEDCIGSHKTPAEIADILATTEKEAARTFL